MNLREANIRELVHLLEPSKIHTYQHWVFEYICSEFISSRYIRRAFITILVSVETAFKKEPRGTVVLNVADQPKGRAPVIPAPNWNSNLSHSS